MKDEFKRLLENRLETGLGLFNGYPKTHPTPCDASAAIEVFGWSLIAEAAQCAASAIVKFTFEAPLARLPGRKTH